MSELQTMMDEAHEQSWLRRGRIGCERKNYKANLSLTPAPRGCISDCPAPARSHSSSLPVPVCVHTHPAFHGACAASSRQQCGIAGARRHTKMIYLQKHAPNGQQTPSDTLRGWEQACGCRAAPPAAARRFRGRPRTARTSPAVKTVRT